MGPDYKISHIWKVNLIFSSYFDAVFFFELIVMRTPGSFLIQGISSIRNGFQIQLDCSKTDVHVGGKPF